MLQGDFGRMPGPAVIEFGVPIQTQTDIPYHFSYRAATRRSGPARGPIVTKDLTLSEVLAEAQFPIWLPVSSVISKYVKLILSNQASKYNTILNIINFISSFFFLTGAIGAFYRFIYYQNNHTLDANEPDSEAGRVMTGGLFSLGSFFITFFSAIINLIILHKIKKNLKIKHDAIIQDYKNLRTNRIKKHTLKQVFFSILEVIQQLKTLRVVDHKYFAEFARLANKLDEDFKKIDFQPNLVIPGVAHVTLMPVDTVIFKLKEILLGEKFEYVTNKITKYITKNILSILNNSIFSTSYDPIKEDYLDNIKHQFYTRCMLLDALALISIMKRRLKASHLFIDSKIINDKTLLTTAEALREYWNSSMLSDKAAYPFDINIEKLSEFANNIIRIHFPALILKRIPLAHPFPMYLPETSSPLVPVLFHYGTDREQAAEYPLAPPRPLLGVP